MTNDRQFRGKIDFINTFKIPVSDLNKIKK